MKTYRYLFWTLIACMGCGGNQQLDKELDDTQNKLRKCQYAMGDMEKKEQELRMEAAPKDTERQVSPPYVGPWHQSFSAIVSQVHKAMEGEEYALRFRNGVLVISVPTVRVFVDGGEKLSEEGIETVASIVGLLKRQEDRNLGITVRSEATRKGNAAGKSGTPPAGTSPTGFDRAVSIKRALAIVSSVEGGGIDPANLVTVGYGLEPDDITLSDKSVVEFFIYPKGAEIPKYPEPK